LCSDLCERVRTLTHLTYDFVQDVLNGATESPAQSRELLDELETKWRQFVLELDVELTQSERTVRANLDKCRISDTRVTWLLEYNRCLLDMRKVFTLTATSIYDDVERVLRVASRGCHTSLTPSIVDKVGGMRQIMDNVQKCVLIECARNDDDH